MVPFPTGATDVLDAAQAEAAATTLAAAPELAVDVEADAMHAFRPRLCFVQVSSDQALFLFDTLAPGVDARPLAELFGDPSRTKFFHAAGGDLPYLAERGVRVRGLFDTHRAATLLGWPKVGLADLVLEKLGVQLAKEHQQSDFSQRPLPPGMREYIADDVRYLCELGRQVREACRQADILEEVELDCLRMAEEAQARPAVGEDFRPKLPRGGRPAAELALIHALVRELHKARLEWAEAANVPMGRMLSNAAVMAIATKPPHSLRDLQRLEGVRGAFVRTHGEAVLERVRSLEAQAKEGALTAEPESSGARDSKRKKREEALKTYRTQKAQARKVTPSVVLPNPLLEGLAANPPESLEALAAWPYFGEKRRALYGAELVALLAAT